MEIIFRPKEGNRERWEIVVDGEIWREVHRTIFGKNPKFPASPENLGEQNLQSLFDAYEYRRAKGYALWRLSAQSYHSDQLAKSLQERLVQSHTVARVIQEFRDLAVFDDDAWLQSFLRTQQKRFGKRAIIAKLYAKGISAENIQKLSLEMNAIDPGEELRAIQHLLNTCYRSKDLRQLKERQKVFASLARKGYRIDQIQSAIRIKSGIDSLIANSK